MPASAPAANLPTTSSPVAGWVEERRLASISALWHETIHTLGTHSAPILACALLGLVGAGLLGAMVNAALTLDIYARTGGIFTNTANNFYLQLLIQAAIGIFGISLARGAISWIALNTSGSNLSAPPLSKGGLEGVPSTRHPQPVTLWAALRASAARMPLLLLSSLMYGALITLGIAGLTLLLRQMRLDVTSVSRVSGDLDSIVRVMVVRVINGLLPDPGSPFSEVVNYARYLLRRSSTNYYWLYAYRYTVGEVPVRLWLIALSSILPLFAAATLLRLRGAAIMSAPRVNQLGALAETVHLGIRHFGYVSTHGAVVWMAGASLTVLFGVMPLTLAQYLLVPAAARALGSLWPYPVSTLMFTVGTSLVTMVILAFGAIYDARLYMAIKQYACKIPSARP
jgi:hypothetical protein